MKNLILKLKKVLKLKKENVIFVVVTKIKFLIGKCIINRFNKLNPNSLNKLNPNRPKDKIFKKQPGAKTHILLQCLIQLGVN